MRSDAKRRRCWPLLGVLSLACQSQDSRIDDLCQRLFDCTNLDVPEDCDDRLEAAVDDHRLSRASLVRCSQCLDNNSPDACPDILVARDCDKACSEVQPVINARTSKMDRERGCGRFHLECGDVLGDSTGCATDLQNKLEADSILASDAQIDACLSCVEPLIDQLPSDGKGGGGTGGAAVGGAGGTAGAAGSAGAAMPPGPDLESCTRLLDRCATACAALEEMDKRFDFAGAALVICRKNVKDCVEGVRNGIGGTGGAAPMPASVELDKCYADLLGKVPDDVTGCASCEAENPVCQDLFANCAHCVALY